METIILALIEKLNSSVFVLLALLVLVFFMIYKSSFHFGRWSEKFFNQDGKIDRLDNMSEKVIVMQTKIDLIYQYVNPNIPTRAQSPISLTSIGKEICDKIDAHEILTKYLPSLMKEIDLANPKNAYDIQNVCIATTKEKLIKYLNESELNKIKQEAYNKGILVEDVLSIFGVLLRNYILKQKNIPISDVDRHSSSD